MFLYEIKEFLDRKVPDKNIFVVPCDMLPSKFELPAGFVVNLSKAHETGSHWVSFWIDAYGKGTYFDSFGFKPLRSEIVSFLKMHTKTWGFNNRQFQQLTSNVCGYYAAVFVFYMANNVPIDMFQKQFSNNLTINDYVMAQIYEKLNN